MARMKSSVNGRTMAKKPVRKMSPAQRTTRESQASMNVTDDGDRVEGKAVIARETAVWTAETIKLPKAIGKPITTVDMLLLEDESVAYQCVHPHRGDCRYTRDNPKSVFSHQRTHSPATLLRAAEAELAMYRERQAQQFQNRSNGAKRAAIARRRGQTETDVVIDETLATNITSSLTPTQSSQPPRTSRHTVKRKLTTPDKLRHLPVAVRQAHDRVAIAYDALLTAQQEFERAYIGYIRIAGAVAESSTPDPQLIIKAQKWDQFVALRDS